MKASRKRPHARRPLFPVRTRVRRGSVARAASPAARPHARNDISQWLSLYSLTSSQAHSALNILASIAVVANSAFAFAAFGRGAYNFFSVGIGLYLFSLIIYVLYFLVCFKIKNTVQKFVINQERADISKMINTIEGRERWIISLMLLVTLVSYASFFAIDYSLAKGKTP